jgi:molybdopterin synthase catalytic subunit
MSESLARITSEPLDRAEVDAAVADPRCGAVVSFAGAVRNHDDGRSVRSLEYQAHPDAERFLAEVCRDVSARTGVPVAAAHRTGPLKIGDLALVAAAAAPHRAEAFAACQLLVDEIKTRVPIWKRQIFADGAAEWVGL